MAFQLAACAEMLWRDRPISWRASRLKEMGFGVGLWNWTDWDLAALERTGATFTIMNGYLKGRLAEKDGAEALLKSARETAIVGTIPVGVEKYAWGSDDTGYLPWVHEAVTKQGGELPEQFTGGTDLNIEAIIALEPDLILAPWSGITQQQFDSLNAFAPTVAYAESPWTIT